MLNWLKKKRKLIIILSIAGVLVSLLAIYISNKLVLKNSVPHIYTNVNEVPENYAGVVLGTSKYLKSGKVNNYFQYRIDAAVALYKAGKIKHIIVSGDNHIKTYDEPEDMRQSLIEAGVPDSCIHLDYAGFRTFDSVIRGREIFGQTSYTIISQPFHNERAVFLARKNGIDAIGFNAKSVEVSYGIRTKIREKFARVKAVLDIYILGTEPKFLGEKIEI